MSGQTNHRIDGKRLWTTLMAMAEIGATPKGGVKRITLTETDQVGRRQFQDWCEALGLIVRSDAMGNMFARREGRDPQRKPVLFGSHLDTQPSGGKFDGALGVIGGLEVMRTLRDLDIITEAPLELVNWTDEEGARFGRAMMGSAVWSGVLPEAEVKAMRDGDGVSVAEGLEAIDAAGPEPASLFPADAYFELHIEQGPILEREAKEIGIVTGAQAMIWYEAVLTGQDAHAGTTPPAARRDALVGAARIITLVDQLMRARGEAGRGTVGRLAVLPNSPNVVPGEVRFTVEFRHPDDQEIAELAEAFPREAQALAEAAGLTLHLKTVFRVNAIAFDTECVDLVRQAASRLGYTSREMVSGAGHDAVHVATRLPAAMIFTQCKDGLSHNEAESIRPEDAEAGTQVLLEAVLARANRR